LKKLIFTILRFIHLIDSPLRLLALFLLTVSSWAEPHALNASSFETEESRRRLTVASGSLLGMESYDNQEYLYCSFTPCVASDGSDGWEPRRCIPVELPNGRYVQASAGGLRAGSESTESYTLEGALRACYQDAYCTAISHPSFYEDEETQDDWRIGSRWYYDFDSFSRLLVMDHLTKMSCKDNFLTGCGNELKECPSGDFVSREQPPECNWMECPVPPPGSAPNQMPVEPPEFTNIDVSCPEDVLQCLNGDFIQRNPGLGCIWNSCPDGSMPFPPTDPVPTHDPTPYPSREPTETPKPSMYNIPLGPNECASDFGACPDGTLVARVNPPYCNFAKCPGEDEFDNLGAEKVQKVWGPWAYAVLGFGVLIFFGLGCYNYKSYKEDKEKRRKKNRRKRKREEEESDESYEERLADKMRRKMSTFTGAPIMPMTPGIGLAAGPMYAPVTPGGPLLNPMTPGGPLLNPTTPGGALLAPIPMTPALGQIPMAFHPTTPGGPLLNPTTPGGALSVAQIAPLSLGPPPGSTFHAGSKSLFMGGGNAFVPVTRPPPNDFQRTKSLFMGTAKTPCANFGNNNFEFPQPGQGPGFGQGMGHPSHINLGNVDHHQTAGHGEPDYPLQNDLDRRTNNQQQQNVDYRQEEYQDGNGYTRRRSNSGAFDNEGDRRQYRGGGGGGGGWESSPRGDLVDREEMGHESPYAMHDNRDESSRRESGANSVVALSHVDDYDTRVPFNRMGSSPSKRSSKRASFKTSLKDSGYEDERSRRGHRPMQTFHALKDDPSGSSGKSRSSGSRHKSTKTMASFRRDDDYSPRTRHKPSKSVYHHKDSPQRPPKGRHKATKTLAFHADDRDSARQRSSKPSTKRSKTSAAHEGRDTRHKYSKSVHSTKKKRGAQKSQYY